MWQYHRSLKQLVNLQGPAMLGPGECVVRLLPVEPHQPENFGVIQVVWQDPVYPECQTVMRLTPRMVQVAKRRTRIIHPTRHELKLEITEHLFAALAILGIDSVIIFVDIGAEVPLFDGSVQPILERMTAAGIQDLPKPRQRLRVSHNSVFVGVEDRPHVVIRQLHRAKSFFSAVIDFSHTWNGWRRIGRQKVGPCTFEQLQELAGARSFGVAWQGALAYRLGLIHQDPASMALQYQLNGELTGPTRRRFLEEEVAHKLLDFVGDLSLVWGGNIPLGDYTAHMAGHALHIEAARQIITEPLSANILALR